ncbi:hypothetical protein [Brasilonema sp. UFV-L1]|uniref:hypothetical protein n=1 Tax=Brasilonema sp. UFV-L1 TaxID=2234130 RepID=UPI00145DEEAB
MSTIIGTNNNNTFLGEVESDFIDGKACNDWLNGGLGNNTRRWRGDSCSLT